MNQRVTAQTNFMTPEDYERMIKRGRSERDLAAAAAQKPMRHWTQALASILGQGFGQVRMEQAERAKQQAEQGQNAALAAVLRNEPGAVDKALKYSGIARDVMEWEANAPQREAAAFELAQARKKAPLDLQSLQSQIDLRNAQIAQARRRAELEAEMLGLNGGAGPAASPAAPSPRPSAAPTTPQPQSRLAGIAGTAAPLAPRAAPPQRSGPSPEEMREIREDYVFNKGRNIGEIRARYRKIDRALQFMAQNGIDPKSPIGASIISNGGEISPQLLKMLKADKVKKDVGSQVAAGLRDVEEKAIQAERAGVDGGGGKYGSLERAIGPQQGADPNAPKSWIGQATQMAAQTFGEIDYQWEQLKNWAYGRDDNQITPDEVRNNIIGGSKGVALIMKKLVRGEGEGPWTDRDQQDLDRLVGSVGEARTLGELKRRLKAVRDRIEANFGAVIPYARDEKQGGPLRATVTPPNPDDVKRRADEILRKRGIIQ